jgi:hypothetical protein
MDRQLVEFHAPFYRLFTQSLFFKKKTAKQ